MKFFFRDGRVSIETIIKNLSNSFKIEDISTYEHQLMTTIIGPILLFVAFINIFLGIYWQLDLWKIAVMFVVFIIGGIGVLHTQRLPYKSRKKVHVTSLIYLVCMIATFVSYYERLSVLMWFILVILSVVGILSYDKTMLYYSLAGYPIFFLLSVFAFPLNTIVIDANFNIALIIMIGLVMLISVFSNSLYREVLGRKLQQYNDIIRRNNEIVVLNSKLMSSEEALKAQNEVLAQYNDELSAAQKRLEHLAYNDTLTGLPNRKMFHEQLNLLLEMERDLGGSAAVIFIDLDDFKKVNDSMGHSAGDTLLIMVTERLKTVVHPRDLLGRLGGDELVLIVRRTISNEQLLTYVQGLRDVLQKPFLLEKKSTRVTASFGIAVWPGDGTGAEELLKAADTAMYKAKYKGKNEIQFYRKEMEEEVLSKIEMENRLLDALRHEQLFLEYQPLIATSNKRIIGFEALLRWESPGFGRISPEVFIPFAEEIGEWVLREACKKIREMRQKEHMDVTISVNISSVQIKNDAFIRKTKEIIEEIGIPPSSLIFEITETVFIHDMDRAVGIIKVLKAYGIKVVLDDFGTGYSSLSYLMDLPIDGLKIDKSFIDAISDNDNKYNIVADIIAMVRGLEIEVVAEGVETDLQLNYLEKKDCDVIQGFLLGKPMAEDLMMSIMTGDE